MEKLLPCPFCGNEEPGVELRNHKDMSWICCCHCGLETPTETGITDADAVAYWNSRTTPMKS